MRHRYIFCGLVNGTDKASNFRLIRSIRRYNLGDVVRINVPDDMDIDHFPYDGYDTTDEERTLDELGWDAYIFYEGRWRKFNFLKQFIPAHWHDVLEYIFNLDFCGHEYGWTGDREKYLKYYKDGMSGKVPFVSPHKWVFPPFKEDKKGLDLPIQLREYRFTEPSCSDEKDWYNYYKKLKKENEQDN